MGTVYSLAPRHTRGPQHRPTCMQGTIRCEFLYSRPWYATVKAVDRVTLIAACKTTNTEMRNECCQVDMSRCKEVHLLETWNSLSLHHRVLVVLHHSTADQTGQPRCRYCICITCQHSQHQWLTQQTLTSHETTGHFHIIDYTGTDNQTITKQNNTSICPSLHKHTLILYLVPFTTSGQQTKDTLFLQTGAPQILTNHSTYNRSFWKQVFPSA